MRRVAAVVIAATAGPSLAQYTPGFVWNRSADWTGGLLEGQSWLNGNPDRDSKGNMVWAAEYTNVGGGLNDNDPWYKKSRFLMQWDANWFGLGFGVWSVQDDFGGLISQAALTHTLDSSFFEAPMARWINPTGAEIQLHITGSTRVVWNGSQNLAVPISVDLVMLQETPLSQTVLLAKTFDDPQPGQNKVKDKFVPFDMVLDVPADGMLAWSIRGRQKEPGRWFDLEDNLTFTLEEVKGQCLPDLNGDGVLDLFDFLAYVNLFNAGC